MVSAAHATSDVMPRAGREAAVCRARGAAAGDGRGGLCHRHGVRRVSRGAVSAHDLWRRRPGRAAPHALRSAAGLRVDRDRARGGDDGHAGAVAFLAAPSVSGRIGAFAVAMGVWDIFYYVFLWLFAGWPASPLGAGHPVPDSAAVVGTRADAGAAGGGDGRGGRRGDGARAGRRPAETESAPSCCW